MMEQRSTLSPEKCARNLSAQDERRSVGDSVSALMSSFFLRRLPEMISSVKVFSFSVEVVIMFVNPMK